MSLVSTPEKTLSWELTMLAVAENMAASIRPTMPMGSTDLQARM